MQLKLSHIVTFLLLISFNVNALEQSQKTIEEISIEYVLELNLGEEVGAKFSQIIFDFNEDMNGEISNSEFNKKMKLRDFEIRKILSKGEFKRYRDIKKELEPDLKFRF